MLGGIRKTAIAGATLGLLSIGLATGPAPVQAATGDACVIAASAAEVNNVEYGLGVGHPGQASNGTWDTPAGPVPRFGLYYPATDAEPTHAAPRVENFGSHPDSDIPATPVQTGDHFLFEQEGSCLNDTVITFSTSGNAIGYCGRSVGLGVGTVGGESVIIRWESVATQLVMLDPSARGSVNAQANPPGDAKGSCLSGTAVTFLVDGALVDARPAP